MLRSFDLRRNIGPGIVVLLISVPLSMGVAIASGVPPAWGLVTAIVGGLVVAPLGGSALQITGPSAGLAVMVLDVVHTHGARALVVVVPLMALIQIGAGLMRLGQVFRAVSPAVINGVLAGIGVLIICAQFHVMLDAAPKENGLQNIITIPEAIYSGLVPSGRSVHHLAALVGVLTLAVLVALSAIKHGPLAKIPAPLPAISLATVVVWALDVPIQHVEMPASLFDAIHPPQLVDLKLLASPSIVIAGVALAFVASAETLLSANAVDAMRQSERTNYDRELLAQGIGNAVSGALGVLPVTGVISRSTANVQAGATSRASALFVGASCLGLMALIPAALSIVPRASLAALLIHVGYQLARSRPLGELRRYGRSELAIFFVTVTTIVTVNLLTGMALGLGLAAAKLIYSRGKRFHRLEIETAKSDTDGQIHIHLRGSASFIRIPRLAATLEKVPTDREVHLHVEELEYIDHACLDLLSKWERERMRARAPVRVQWKTLHHRYHAGNLLDRTPEEHAQVPEQKERLLDFITPRVVLIDPPFADKWQAIETLSRLITGVYQLEDGDALTDSVKERERDVTTCIGHGLMIPHGTLRRDSRMLGAMAISTSGWAFETPDGSPVRCIVLLATPSGEASRHLAVLASFARLFMNTPDLREALLAATTAVEACARLRGEGSESINYAFESQV